MNNSTDVVITSHDADILDISDKERDGWGKI